MDRNGSKGEANPMTEELVRNFLREKGYWATEQLLEQEQRSQGIAKFAKNMRLDCHTDTANQVRTHNPRELDPEKYEQCYSTLHSWVQKHPMEKYRVEISQVLWPLFVHVYLQLLQNDFPKNAEDFLEGHHEEHASHSTEIGNLKAIRDRSQIATNPVAKQFRHKVDMQMSSQAYEMLVEFLDKNNFMLLTRMLHQHITVDIVSSEPSASSESSEKLVSSHTGRWGLLKEIDDVVHPNSSFDDDPDAPAAKRRREHPEPLSRESDDGLPKLSKVARAKLIEDLKCRAPLSSSALPSVLTYTVLNSHGTTNSVSVSSDGQYVAAGLSDSSVRLWDMKKQQQEQERVELDAKGLDDKEDATQACRRLIGHSGPVFGSCFSSDNRFLLTSSEDCSIRLWEMEDCLNLVAYKGHNFPVWDVSFCPLGHYFASASYDRTARLWSTDRIYPLRLFVGHVAPVDTVRFHPNCNYVATGSSDKTVRLWDVQTGDCVRLLTGHKRGVNCVSISSCGRYLASGDDAAVIKVWELGTGREVFELSGHESSVTCVDFANQSSLLASSSMDHTVRLWDVAKPTGKVAKQANTDILRTLRTKSSPVTYLAFTPRNLLLSAAIFSP